MRNDVPSIRTMGIQSDFAGQTDHNVLLIRLADETYALPSAHVREVGRYRAFTPVPGAPPAIPGIISQRGVILPVVDLRLVLGMPFAETTRSTRLVTVVYEDTDMALLVDAVIDLATIPAEAFGQPPTGLDPARARFLSAVAFYEDQTIALLDVVVIVAALREA
ncbi:CheW protein [Roseiflexus castenholzii DSM 13941]|uniref:CheW protein n=2 Tax=Roseiflexus castenholzii TaxID=120962 RepID=A7NRN4_ROSCS|nr:CheW protein [Roseiflexus castenholzii DSM 13941]